MELLRIVAMLFVLVLHAGYMVFGKPAPAGIREEPFAAALPIFTETATIVAVDVFVLISGWFGLRASLAGAVRLLFQCIFIALAVLSMSAVLVVADGCAPPTAKAIYDSFFNYWFLWSYLILYVISPVLNAYAERAGKRHFGWLLASFYLVQTLTDFLAFSDDFQSGHSALSFAGLYLLARYVRLHCPRLTRIRTRHYLAVYLLYVVSVTLLTETVAFVFPDSLFDVVAGRLIRYSSPLVVVAAMALVLAFARLRFTSRVVNTLAAGSFAAYLLNCNELLLPFHIVPLLWLRDHLPITPFLCTAMAYIIVFFLAAVLLDRLRIICWRHLARHTALTQN